MGKEDGYLYSSGLMMRTGFTWNNSCASKGIDRVLRLFGFLGLPVRFCLVNCLPGLVVKLNLISSGLEIYS